jgi:ribonuclease T2
VGKWNFPVAETARREVALPVALVGDCGLYTRLVPPDKGVSRLHRLIGLVLTLIALAASGSGRAEAFDYYVLALSWNPSWCALTGDARAAPECAVGTGRGFTLHGLWPQHEAGWPENCVAVARDPSRRETAAQADIMGSGGLAWHQWVKHGRCTGLAPEAYFAAARTAYAAVALPESPHDVSRITPGALLAQLRALNPDLPEDGAIVTCRAGMAGEVRLCLTKALDPRPCAPDVLARACATERPVLLPPPR